MAITYKIWDFPTVPVRAQMFHVPGLSFDGGFTSGGVRIMSPEPGGRAVLEVEVALQVNEWDFPFASWISSKVNGEIFRIQLTRTPQLVSYGSLNGSDPSNYLSYGVPWEPTGILSEKMWDNGEFWDDDGVSLLAASSLEGSSNIFIDMQNLGEILKHGHVIGHDNYSYVIDDIEYDGNIATVSVKPPLRKNIILNDEIYLRPYFLGIIANGDNIKSMYSADMVGNIEIGTFVFQEVVI